MAVGVHRARPAALVNLRLHAERSRLPQPDPEEFYLADLVGLEARDAAGAAIGRVATVHDYGAGTSLEIDRPGDKALIIPFTRAAVPDVDTEHGWITVLPPNEIDVADVA